jgi:hypothetical protein
MKDYIEDQQRAREICGYEGCPTPTMHCDVEIRDETMKTIIE